MIRRGYVINLPARADRLRAFTSRWEASFLGHIDLRVQPASDLPDPARGCLRSHLAALEEAARTDPEEPVLILEDDAVFTDAFPWPSTPPPDWDVLWLGCQHIAAPRPVRGGLGYFVTGWVTPVEIMRTHGYLARRPGQVAELLRRADHGGLPPRIDPYLSRLPLRHYAVEPQTVGQAAGPSDTGGPPLGHDTYWHLAGSPMGSSRWPR